MDSKNILLLAKEHDDMIIAIAELDKARGYSINNESLVHISLSIILKALAKREWQPIETIEPNDTVLLWGDYKGKLPVTGYYSSVHGKFTTKYHIANFKPTHWKPLDLPPTEKG